MSYRCLIIDDEPHAQKVLESHISRLPFLVLSKKCNNAIAAIEYLTNNSVDIIFLDIMMPEISGFEFLKSLSNPPQIIVTTAFSEFALESYEYSIVDYLSKPISFERFLKAVNKLVKQNKQQLIENRDENEFMFFKCDKIIHKVFFKDLKYIEAFGNYLKIFNPLKTLVVLDTLNNIQTKLPQNQFVRTHKSFIVGVRHISSVEGNMIKIADTTIPIGRNFRNSVLEKLGNISN